MLSVSLTCRLCPQTALCWHESRRGCPQEGAGTKDNHIHVYNATVKPITFYSQKTISNRTGHCLRIQPSSQAQASEDPQQLTVFGKDSFTFCLSSSVKSSAWNLPSTPLFRELSPPTSESSSPVSTGKPPLDVAGRARDFLLNLLLLLSKSHLSQPVISFHTAHSLI